MFTNSFFIPRFKWQLLDILNRHYPEDEKALKRKPKKQLIAIYLSMRQKIGR